MSTLAQNFEDYLVKNSEVSDKTLRNYRADLANFLKWSKGFLAFRRIPLDDGGETLIQNISHFLIKEYLMSITQAKTPPATINRRLSTLRAFGKFLTKSGHLKDNPFTFFQNVANPKKSVVSQPVSDKPKTDNRYPTYSLAIIASILLVISLTQAYFLLKRPAAEGPKNSAVLGTAEVGYQVVPRYPLPAPAITFGDILSK